MAKTYRMKEAQGRGRSADVTDGSPAEKAGLKPGDVVVAADGRPIEDNGDLSRYIASQGARQPRCGWRSCATAPRSTIVGDPGDVPGRGRGGRGRGGAKGAQLGMTLRELTPAAGRAARSCPRTARACVVMEVGGRGGGRGRRPPAGRRDRERQRAGRSRTSDEFEPADREGPRGRGGAPARAPTATLTLRRPEAA